ncbi:DUF72 domain-containing protein [Variovorax sp. PDNC026]|uniref:DUF72 domain-containing protein n=1 Tax=Variovorax sp. PDNC026 TaxID=2811425 RepID=UPI001F0696CC|nr:DUF72 domain-containing protein [Variovorax sp. PDNC026]
MDSSYYAMPSEENSRLWVERTPEGFTFNVKAFRLFTGHLTQTEVLPADLCLQLGTNRRVYCKDVGDDIKDEMWERFAGALEPLRAAGSLGLIHFQLPPSVRLGRRLMQHVEECIRRLPGHPVSVEFGHKDWRQGPERVADTLAWLRDIGAVHTVVDGPQEAVNSVPAVWEATHPEIALVRLHGRNNIAYNMSMNSAAERFEYDYLDDELAELAGEAVRLAFKVKNTHIILNNCYEDKGQRNALTFMRKLLEDAR